MASGVEEPLPGVPRLVAYLVESPLEEVASLFRGESLSATLSTPEWPPGVEICGEGARIADKFGPEVWGGGVYAFLADHYPLRGHARVSVVRSNPRFVLVEHWEESIRPWFDEELYNWTGADVYLFVSIVGKDPHRELPQRFWWPEEYPQHLFAAFGARKERMVSGYKDGSRFRFKSKGNPLAFEDPTHYTRRLVKDRLNRKIICDYMSALGIDPVATFVRRELDNPILFTHDHEGEPLDRYQDALKRYHAFMA